MIYLAHIRQDGAIQTVQEHCTATAGLAKKYGESLGLSSSMQLAGLLHDAGKCSKEFSGYIKKAANGETVQRGSIIHSFAAVRYLLNTFHQSNNSMELLTAELLSIATGSHHGLFDCFDKNGNCGFSHRVNTQPKYDDAAMQSFLEYIASQPDIQVLFEKSQKEIESIFQEIKHHSSGQNEALFELSLLSRLLTSALIDADRTDTAAFMDNKAVTIETKDDSNTPWEQCLIHFNTYIAGFQADTPVQNRRISSLLLMMSLSPSAQGGVD